MMTPFPCHSGMLIYVHPPFLQLLPLTRDRQADRLNRGHHTINTTQQGGTSWKVNEHARFYYILVWICEPTDLYTVVHMALDPYLLTRPDGGKVEEPPTPSSGVEMMNPRGGGGEMIEEEHTRRHHLPSWLLCTPNIIPTTTVLFFKLKVGRMISSEDP